MDLSRRRLLSLLSAAGVLPVLAPRLAGAAAATDADRVLANTVAIFAGTEQTNARPEVADKVAAIVSTAADRLHRLDTAGDGELFAGQPLGTDSSNLNAAYQYLYEIALATRTPGSDLQGDIEVQRRVLDGLVWLYENYYGDQSAGYYGNWFHWEIGISNSVTRILVLLADVVSTQRPGLVDTYVAAMDAYLRSGKDGDVDLDSRFHTGANLADITTNRILQGAVLGDDERIHKAIEDQLTVFATIDPYNLKHGNTDGYYADGSFIQHHSVAYTGSYGKALLTRVVQTLKILDGSGYANGEALVPVVHRWVANGFAPLIFEGWMMEIVKGRAVSRTGSGYDDVAVIVEAVVDLAAYSAGADAAALRSYVAFIRASSRTTLDPSDFESPISIARYADIVDDDSIVPADLNPASRTVAFNAMDRTVHRRPGYAFALARSSDRISKYEYMNGENLMPWFQGDGAYYLYLSGVDQAEAFGVDYYTVVSPYRLAGVTAPVEQRQTIPQLYGERWYENPDHPLEFTSSSESQNTYVYFPRGTNQHSGGATLGAYGAAALIQSDDVAYADKQEGILPDDFVVYRNANATKSWFLLDDEIVVLAAGVGDEAGRAVTTTVDSRLAEPSDDVTVHGVLRSGDEWAGPGTADLRWLRYANATHGTAVGYLFLGGGPVDVALDEVTRSHRVIRLSNRDTDVTKNVFGVTYEHAAGAEPATLAYALVPHATAEGMQVYDDGRLSVVANDVQVQAITHSGLNLVAANTFGPGSHEAAGIVIDGAASVLVQTRADRVTTVAVSDPTMRRDSVTVVLRGRRLTKISSGRGVRVSHTDDGTRLDVDTHHLYGGTRTIRLRG
ncbi:polysaccharide lyase family 8 super-sandwich domain-containing protein [Haloactinopolyspora sp.]|uniref:polysaccharide lyase family 8 super-sandwich domain-containing protein n=1 Tax=Haloactinopolyspora sp. TaxID=1966353 RepID=UPI002609B353|nr:polysaccharide lyase family 8 super-sandwich domain-containing protein [Haloactinopolyspora sp.]